MRNMLIEWFEGIVLLFLLIAYPRVQRYLWMRRPIEMEGPRRHEH